MPRRLRRDYPGAWHHVVDRGIARRTLFESRRDVRTLLACLARQVREGDLEIHAYAILTTHFHLLVRSPRGRLSAAMQRALDAYARWFNRSRRRDGPLFRARFVNRVIDSDAYWSSVLRYIDRNPVSAGLVRCPSDWPHGSAWHYARARGPLWLSRAVVEAEIRGTDKGPWDPAAYARFEERQPTPGERWVVGRRLEGHRPREEDPLDDLLAAAPGRVREWMRRKASLADGSSPGWPVASPAGIHASLAGIPGTGPEGTVLLGSNRVPRREVLEAGLLRLCAGLRQREIAAAMGLPLAAVQRRIAAFARVLASDAGLLADSSAVLEDALRRDHSPRERRAVAGSLLVPAPVGQREESGVTFVEGSSG